MERYLVVQIILNMSGVVFDIYQRYENDYENLRNDYGVPDVFDFGISSEIITMEREITGNPDVVVTDFVERVIFADGQIRNVRFSFSVW